MAKLKGPWLLMVIIACILSVYVIKVHAHICEVGRERNQYNEWKWVLSYPNPCECTKIIMAGMNTWAPVYPFDPVYVDSPLLSDNVGAIRKHYRLRCRTETSTSTKAWSKITYLASNDDTTSAAAYTSTEAGASITSSANNEDTISAAATTSTDAGASITSSANNGDTTSTPVSTSTDARTACTMTYSNTNEDTTSAAASAINKGEATIKSSPRSKDTASGISTTTRAAPIITQGCCDYLGMEKHHIPDQNINASGYKYNYYPQNGRLNAASAWWAAQTAAPWIQADIGYQTYVSGVITQGGGTAFCCWVKQLKVSTFESNTNNLEIFVKDEDGSLKIFDGNSYGNTLKESTFTYPVYARVIRITCLARHENAWMMRFEILGCKLK